MSMGLAQPVTHTNTESGTKAYIKALAQYYRLMPSVGGTGLRPQGVVMRTKLPNQASTHIPRPSGRPPAEHLVHQLAVHMAKPKAPKEMLFKPRAEKIVHPGKALALRKVKAIHLSNPHIYKVKA